MSNLPESSVPVVPLSKKVCLLGDFAVGKTSLVRRFVYNLFDDRYISTIGVKVSRKTVAISQENQIVELGIVLWDLAGSEEFNQVRASYLRGASGAMLVCDLTRPHTLDSLINYAKDIRLINEDVQLIIAANKYDLTDEVRLTEDVLQEVAQELSAPYFFTSARSGYEVEDIFRALGGLLVSE